VPENLDVDRSCAHRGAASRRWLLAVSLAVGVLVAALAVIESVWDLATARVYEHTASPPRPSGAASP
jgi:hypothetical protein